MSETQLKENGEMEDLSRGNIVMRAVKLVPIVKYAVAVAAIAALVSVIATYGVATPSGLFATIIIIVLMVPVYLFDKVVPKIPNKQAVAAASVLMWFCLLLFMTAGVLLVWAGFVNGQVRAAISDIATDVSDSVMPFFQRLHPPPKEPPEEITENRFTYFDLKQISESRFQADVQYEFVDFMGQKTGTFDLAATGKWEGKEDPTAKFVTSGPPIEVGRHKVTLILTYTEGTTPLSDWYIAPCMVWVGGERNCGNGEGWSGPILRPLKQLEPDASKTN